MKSLFGIKIRKRHRHLFGLLKEYRYRFCFSILCMLVVAGSTAASAYLIKPVIDDIFVNKNYDMLKILPAAVILLYFLRGLSVYGQEYFMGYIGEGIIRRLRDTLYNRISELSLSFYHKETTGVLMSRITNDVNIIKNMVSTTVTGLLRDVISIVFLTVLIFVLIWKMAMFALIILPVAFYPIVIFGRRVRRFSTGCQEKMAGMNAFLHETLAGNKIVKAFGMEDFEKERFSKKNGELLKIELKAVKARAVSSPVMESLAGVGIAFIIWYGGNNVIAGVYTAGTFMAFLAAVVSLYTPVKKVSKLNNVIQQGLAAADRVYDIIETESEISESEHPEELKQGPHRVTFEKVFFKYEEDLVLKGINLDVKAGEILALAGMSGGGKSSLVNLIPRFYDVCGGSIRIDGIDIRDASLSSVRSQIAIVTQEPILFNDTVRNNIAYGNLHASEEEIIQAAKASYAYDFIQKFSKGFDTTIGELGSRLSGGEKQRICIARALLKNAPILILDEATSSLDAEAEMLVQNALENLMKGRTTFVIAHRLSTIGHADRIVVIVGGRIVEEGGHEQLLEKEGEYYKLHQMQFKDGG